MKHRTSVYALDGETAGPDYKRVSPSAAAAPPKGLYMAATPIFVTDAEGVHRAEGIMLEQ